MKKEFIRIEERINRLYEMHQIHMASFEKEAFPDLEKQSKERESEVKALITDLKKMLTTTKNKPMPHVESMTRVLKNRLTTLLEQNKALRTKVSAVKDRLKKGMKQMSKGKKVISSYRAASVVSNSPRVISITTE